MNLDIDFAGKDIDEIIKAARAKFGNIDADLAIELLTGKLQVSKGYYSWAHLEGAWFVRVPSQERLDEEWLKNEPPELIHVCAPVKFLTAVETMANKEESAHHVGYARDNDNKLEVECSRCKQKTSEDAAKKAIFQTKMHTLQKKVG